jgi:heme-degrading monooxygenase HmoA
VGSGDLTQRRKDAETQSGQQIKGMQVSSPYYAVIFSSVRTDVDAAGYEKMAARMVELAQQQPGFLGVESARGADGRGITVSYWESEEAIRGWREHAEHRVAQDLGRTKWYASFWLRVCRVERAWDM